jgi:hypothetical protein
MKKIPATALILIICSGLYGQNDSITNADVGGGQVVKDSLPVMAAGKQFKASAWKSLWWGKHYRKEWATPVAFPVLHLSTFDGGLTPVKAGGGHESKTLRLMSAAGREYVLRSIDKSLDVLVPDDFKGTFINDIVNDQISTAHPYGAVAIAHMAGSLSFMHATPVTWYVPDDPALGEFRSTFANKLCQLEERPSGKGWDHSPIFGNADEIVNTEKMLEKVFESSRNTVDQHSFLQVRLFDMLINDWDRHEDQWVWAMKKGNGNNIFIPIARDRDQAFSKTDGITLWLLSRRWALRSLQNMDPHIRDVAGINLSARNLDRQFLNELTIDDWQRSVSFIQTHLKDSSIRNGIYSMPTEVNKISGNFLTKRLIQRRDHLMRDAMRYYSFFNKQVTITGSEDNEQFIIDQDKKNEVSVTGLRSGTDTFYHRVFYRNETKQINIYALGGDDQYIVKGNATNRFRIRLIGGEGTNSYTATENSGHGRSYKVYDSLLQGNLSHKVFRPNRYWDTLYRYKRAAVKYNWCLPLIIPGYNPDDEISIAVGLLYKKQTWGKTPFGWQQQFTVDYATGTSAIGFSYKGLFKQTFRKWDLDLDAYYKGPRYTFNYYGFGNETALMGGTKSFFRVKANDLFFSPGISRTWQQSQLRFGLQYERVEVLRSQDKFITTPESNLDSAVFSDLNFAGINGQWTFSNNNEERYRKKGVQFTTGFSYTHNLDNTDRRMLKINGAVSFYHTFFNWLTFAHRTGASTISGDYEFYQASTLGGNQNLRGYWRSRFAGRSAFYQNTDLRISLGNLRGYVVRGKLGIFGFIDDGRVWIKDEHSSTIHTGYGGGVFLLPYNSATLSLYYASSNEASMITLRTGFFF